MARIRSIKPKFWDDLKIAKLSRDARLIFIALWNFADDLGTVPADHVWLKSKILPFDKVKPGLFKKWVSELQAINLITEFSHKDEKYYSIRNFSKHQVINRPNLNDLFIIESELPKFTEQSLNNHGGGHDESVPEGSRRGKEGKGVGEDDSNYYYNLKSSLKNNASLIERCCRENGLNESLFILALNDFFDYAESRKKKWTDETDCTGNFQTWVPLNMDRLINSTTKKHELAHDE